MHGSESDSQLYPGLSSTDGELKSERSTSSGGQVFRQSAVEGQDAPQKITLQRNLFTAYGAVGMSILSLILVVVYETGDAKDLYGGGVGWEDENQLHGYHAIFMTAGMLTGATGAMHAWGILGATSLARQTTKMIHHLLFSLSIVFIALGLYAIDKSNCYEDSNGSTVCYVAVTELHHVLGIAALFVFLSQFIVAAAIYGFGIGGEKWKKELFKNHRAIGIASLALSTANILVGMQMQLGGYGSCDLPSTNEGDYLENHYEDVTPACKIINGAGISAAISLVLSILTLVN